MVWLYVGSLVLQIFFCTFTCNPKWQEIADALAMEPGQVYSDRPDITTRVFRLKADGFLADIKNVSAFGPINACKYMYLFFVLSIY